MSQNTSAHHALLAQAALPNFADFAVELIEPALDELLSRNRKKIAQLLASFEQQAPTWQTLVLPMEEWGDEINNFWSPVSHLNGVKNSDALRDVYNACLPKLTEYGTELGQNQDLFKAYQQLANSEHFKTLNTAQQKVINNELRDFKLSGIALEGADKQRFVELKQRLAELGTQFSNNVLDATHGWYKHITDVQELSGVPETALAMYQQLAQQKQLTGYVISLDIPAYLPAMQYADNAALREELYRAYNTRASELGMALNGDGKQWDNSALIEETLALRQELAQLLGFNNYAERSLATKMAESCEQVLGFLNDLAEHSFKIAQQDFAELEAYAQQQGAAQVNAWDVAYYSEKLRLAKYDLSQEQLRPYFPADKVIAGMFATVKRLFAIDIEEQKTFDSWHGDARLFSIKKDGQLIAQFYLDIFARQHKRGGAWMADCRVRRIKQNGELQLPVAFLTCNFSQPTADTPSLLTHNEVTTLFHEFGHGLHHMLTQIDCASVSGINGVAWDAVELPSQFLENWCWEKEAIAIISGHYQTGETLPDELLEKMLAARNFQSGMQMMRQIEFSLFDFSLHMQTDNNLSVQELLNQVREKTSVYPTPEFNRFQNSFSHIFAGGYAAGYYSYKWAEVLSADAFSRFEEEGIFNAETGRSFLENILTMGGSKEPMELFEAFRGRKPTTAALLRHSGIAA
ncbi:M3 family metallopeptidase [Dasania sp. GY-MA-18]|uniref:oligopeptidase A n=1 Tax=Dasania phycosphaerae TaxID=2950436 RepID=A0A9J6RPL4_9GAMM|nr:MULTISPECIES: M3 family metallopeptidase [Dasania]MCR8923856.1 M3 family metallopeptidase [Dasania sp. GY-MA-18]MCZ0866290.1 M3 family metallopeptidase [Dasania phycosphaerae]MCZ0870014.1 M3 family metallopeptidase [Dasania phycosphaerae]